MSITITDPKLLEALSGTRESVELTAPDGRVLGMFYVENPGRLPPGVKSPFTEEEMQERRKDRSGRPLADILRDLQKRHHRRGPS